jgi:catechol 2,3-dioxygenase-like lactoylglutathione lyase family enzyme
MFDHISITVGDLKASEIFYTAALAPLGFKKLFEVTAEMTGGKDAYVGFGSVRPQFWIGMGAPKTAAVHLAFSALNRKSVDLFYHAALAAGGRENGAPGLRPHYHADYYGAFIFDLDSNNIEAVCHNPE